MNAMNTLPLQVTGAATLLALVLAFWLKSGDVLRARLRGLVLRLDHIGTTIAAIIACLSYNILLGQGGMLSFGHAVYTGLGSYMAIHALNAVTGGKLNIPVSLLPIVGGVAGLAVGAAIADSANHKKKKY